MKRELGAGGLDIWIFAFILKCSAIRLTPSPRTPLRFAVLHGMGSCVDLVMEMHNLGAKITSSLVDDFEIRMINHRPGMTIL